MMESVLPKGGWGWGGGGGYGNIYAVKVMVFKKFSLI